MVYSFGMICSPSAGAPVDAHRPLQSPTDSMTIPSRRIGPSEASRTLAALLALLQVFGLLATGALSPSVVAATFEAPWLLAAADDEDDEDDDDEDDDSSTYDSGGTPLRRYTPRYRYQSSQTDRSTETAVTRPSHRRTSGHHRQHRVRRAARQTHHRASTRARARHYSHQGRRAKSFRNPRRRNAVARAHTRSHHATRGVRHHVNRTTRQHSRRIGTRQHLEHRRSHASAKRPGRGSVHQPSGRRHRPHSHRSSSPRPTRYRSVHHERARTGNKTSPHRAKSAVSSKRPQGSDRHVQRRTLHRASRSTAPARSVPHSRRQTRPSKVGLAQRAQSNAARGSTASMNRGHHGHSLSPRPRGTAKHPSRPATRHP